MYTHRFIKILLYIHKKITKKQKFERANTTNPKTPEEYNPYLLPLDLHIHIPFVLSDLLNRNKITIQEAFEFYPHYIEFRELVEYIFKLHLDGEIKINLTS